MSNGPKDDIPRPESDVEALQLSREEARAVLDHQIDILADIDDKAMRTVRITLILVGIVLSATTFPGARPFLNTATILGIGFLILAIASGILTYSASRVELGVGQLYLRDVRNEQYDHREWLSVVLAGYEEWINEMDEINDSNATILALTQLSLIFGIFLLAGGILCGLFGWLEPIVPPQPLGGGG